MSFSSVVQIFAGIAVLVYGIIIMGDALQAIAGDRLRKLIGSLTSTPIKGLLVGTVVTSILQSSSATTVMVVSFVDAGFMTLVQAIGVILGANIGTTVTAQLIAFKITDAAYLCAVVGSAICILCRKKRNKQIGVGLVGFGLLFIGMEMMQGPMSFLKERPDLLVAFGDHLFLAFLSGLAITLLVQSSSATVGLTMAVAAQGVIPLETAIAVIFGDNIGTTITAVIASLGGNRSAKQAALSHVMIKIIGSLLLFMCLPFYTDLILMTSNNISRQVANAHTIFNVVVALMFLPFVLPYSKFIRKILPDDENQEVLGAKYLNASLIAISPAAAVDAVKMELIRLSYMSLRMIESCKDILVNGNEKIIDSVYRTENNVNELTKDIIHYTAELGQTGLSKDLSILLNSCTNAVGDVERIGDHATNLIEVSQFLADNNLKFSTQALSECEEMFDTVLLSLKKSISAVEEENPNYANEVIVLEKKVDKMEKDLRAKHIERLNAGSCVAGAGVNFIDILSNLERVGDHANNLAMVAFDIERMHNNGVSSKKKKTEVEVDA
ncbi:MAG: Na/Pi cotransporter family protein [Synergistaceae bacterium]